MYSLFFKRERQYDVDPFRAEEIINRGILQQQTIMYSSFFKRELNLNLRGHSRITHHPPALPDAAKYADRLHTQIDSILETPSG